MGEGSLAQPRCWLTWTSLFTLLSLGLYLFMAGQYGQYAMLRAAVKQTQQGTGAGATTLG